MRYCSASSIWLAVSLRHGTPRSGFRRIIRPCVPCWAYRSFWKGVLFPGEVQYLQTWLSRLRAKLEPNAGTSPRITITFPGLGYRMGAHQLRIMMLIRSPRNCFPRHAPLQCLSECVGYHLDFRRSFRVFPRQRCPRTCRMPLPFRLTSGRDCLLPVYLSELPTCRLLSLLPSQKPDPKPAIAPS